MKTELQGIEGGGATSAAGWLASGVAAGLKANRADMAIRCSDRPAACAALFTSNNVPAAPGAPPARSARPRSCSGAPR